MKIKEITCEKILFDNGNKIFGDHVPDCCEDNFADFEYLEDECGIFDFDFPEDLMFEKLDDGFRFGSKERMFYVPCYSLQNGYYSSDVEIYYRNEDKIKCIFSIDCDSRFSDPRYIDYHITLTTQSKKEFIPIDIFNEINELLHFDIIEYTGVPKSQKMKRLTDYYEIAFEMYYRDKKGTTWRNNYCDILKKISQEEPNLYINISVTDELHNHELISVFLNGRQL